MSSSGYDRLFHEFKDILGDVYLIEVYRGEGDGSSYRIEYGDASSSPVTMSYAGISKDDWEKTHIQGIDLTFKFYIPRDEVFVVEDLLESQYKEWKVRFSKGGTVLFLGYAKPENMYRRYEINPPYLEVELGATDGLAELKDIDFTAPDAIDPITGDIKLLEAIKYALTPLGLELPFKVAVNTIEITDVGNWTTTCPLAEVFCNAKRFYELSVVNAQYIAEPIKCWEALEYVLKTFNCKLFQHNGYYCIVNHLETVSNDAATVYNFTWDLTYINQTTEYPLVDLSDDKYVPYVEEQKVHPLKSILSKVINVNTGTQAKDDEGLNIDFTDWLNVWEFSDQAEAHFSLLEVQSDGSLRTKTEDTDQPWMELKETIHIDVETDSLGNELAPTYLRFTGAFKLWAWDAVVKWWGKVGKIENVDIKIAIEKNGVWSKYLSLGCPQITYVNFDTYAKSLFQIHGSGNYRVRFLIDSLEGAQHYDVLGVQLKDFNVVVYNGIDKDYNPTEVNSGPSFYQININGYEDYEQELQLFDAVSEGDIAALKVPDGTDYRLTTKWNTWGGSENASIIDINSRYILNNRSKYKNFLRCTIVDLELKVEFDDIIKIHNRYYAFVSFNRNYLNRQIECELIELICQDLSTYDEIEDITQNVTVVEPIEAGTEKGENRNIVSLKTAPIRTFEVGDVIRAEGELNDPENAEYYLAQADSLEHATAIGIVSEVIDDGTFKYISNGYLPMEIFPVIVGQYYWLSPTEPGKMVTGPTYEQYEIEQAIGFGTEKGLYVEIDARNLNFKEIVETSQIPGGIPIYMHWENSDIQTEDSYTESDPSSGDSSGYEFYPSDYDKALLETPGDVACVYGTQIKQSYGEIVIKKFITEPGVPNTTLIPAGGWFFETYLAPSIQNVLSYTVHVYKRNEVGIETELFSFEQRLTTPNYLQRYDYAYASDEIVLEATDRLVFEYCAKSTIGPLETVRLFVEGDTRTNVKIPIFVELLNLTDKYVTDMLFDDSSRELTLKRNNNLPDLTVVIPGEEFLNIEDFDFDWNDITTGVSQTYILKVRASYAYRIVSVVLQSDTTMDDITIEINGNPITWEDESISIDVTTTPLEKVAKFEYDNLVEIGDQVTLVTSGTDAFAEVLRGSLRTVRSSDIQTSSL